MDDSAQKRMSAIPRLSKLPRPASGIPKPAATTTLPLPRPTSTATIRPKPSRDSLGGELRNPRLRPSLSHNQLRSSIGGPGDLRNPRLRATASREQLNPASRRTSLAARPPPQLLSHSPRPSFSHAPSTPPRDTDIEEQSTTPPFEPPGEALGQETDGRIFSRRLTLTRRPSEVFAAAPFSAQGHAPTSSFDNDQIRPTTASTEGSLPPALDFTKSRSKKPRPSLSERTMETLAQIPSSPAVGKKSSSFFDQGRPSSRTDGRPRSRADSTGSRPGSSYTSDGSAKLQLKGGSRPGSSSGHYDMGFASFRASTNSYKPPLTTIQGTPQKRVSAIQTTKTPNPRVPASRSGFAATSKMPSLPDGRSPSPTKMSLPKAGSRTVAARPTRAKGSVNNLFKKPSLPALDRSATNDEAPASPTNAWDGSIRPLVPSTTPKSSPSRALNSNSLEPSTPDSSRKSSAALREQIAKAKAARRAEMQRAAAAQQCVSQPPAPQSQQEQETPIIPVDDGFDFGMTRADPFNQHRGESPKKKVLQQRINAARTSGRLNIAALDLKEIPMEVMKMYDFESSGQYDGSWAESVDLTRFVAADNEFEELDEFIFPDTASGSFDDAQEGQGNIFGGLETLDMHGNLLVGVPLGFRRLNYLTSLNLVGFLAFLWS